MSAAAGSGAGTLPARRRRRPRPALIVVWAALIALTAIFLLPMAWMVSTSFKTVNGATSIPPAWWPHPLTAGSYHQLMSPGSQFPVLRWFVNSLLAGLGNALLIVAVDAPAAYALARMEFRFRKAIFAIIVGTLFIPVFVLLIPNFLIVDKLGWLDSLWVLIVPNAGGALGVFLLRQFFLSLPHELEEAALLDGATHWRIFLSIVLPLSKPALATLVVLSFLTNWNDFLWPVFVLFNPQHLTLPAGLSALESAGVTNYPIMMAGAVVASIPAIALFVLAQRYIIAGISRTGLKA
jgi:multiple sugar transport system permease protein